MNHDHYRDQLSDQPLETEFLEEGTIADGFRPLKYFTVRHARLGGEGTVGPLRRELLHCRPVATIIPYDPKLDAIVVVRQFRIGAALRLDLAAALELPAGLMDEGEALEATARRELREETGLETIAIERCFRIMPSPGTVDEHVTFFLAIVDATKLQLESGLVDEHEDIRPIAAPVEALIEAVDEGRVENGLLVAGVHWFARKGRAEARALAGMAVSEEEAL